MLQKLLACLLILSSFTLGAQTEANVLFHWEDNTITPNPWLNLRYNEVWGMALDGREYGIIGTTDGMRVFDLTDPLNVPAPVVIPAPATGSGIVHRDMKDFRGYLYAVCDEDGASTLQIVDMHELPAAAPVVYSSNEFVITAHDLYIDTAQARLYLLGANNGSTRVLDISNPVAPQLLAIYPNASLALPYVHDAYINNHVGIMNCGNDGLYVVDFSDVTHPEILGTMTSYPGAGYNHSGWMADDGRNYILCDETHGSPVKVVSMGDLQDMSVIATMNANSAVSQIPHNAIVRENLVFVSYYYDGLQVYDISNPEAPVRVAYFDTYPGQNQAGFAGAWGVNPNLPSGLVLISDLNTGFWVFSPIDQPADFQLRTNYPFVVMCEEEQTVFRLTPGNDFGTLGSIQIDGLPAGATFSTSTMNPVAGEPVYVTINNLSAGNYPLQCSVSDGVHTGEALVRVIVKPSGAADLTTPVDGAIDLNLTIALKWAALNGANSYKLELSSQAGTNFDDNIFKTVNTTSTTVLTTGFGLQYGTTYYWRVSVPSPCGEKASAIFSFTTKTLVSTSEWANNRLSVYPNPATTRVEVSFDKMLDEQVNCVLSTLDGRLLGNWTIHEGNNRIALPVESLPAGQYILSLQSATNTERRMMVKQ